MPIKSRWSIDIPNCSLPTYLFSSPTSPLDDQKKHLIEAANDTRFLTIEALRLWSQRFATGLRKAGLKRGDRVLLFSSNDLFFPVVFIGVLMAGGIFTGANPTFVPRELAYQLKDSDATFLICNDSVIDTGIAAAKLIGMSKDKIFVFNGDIYDGRGSGKHGCRYWGDLIAPAAEGREFVWDDLRGPGECHRTLALNYSSGTTGVPKGVEITHKNYVSNTEQMIFVAMRHEKYKEKQPFIRQICFLPMYHAMAQTIFIANCLRLRIPVYIMPKFDFLLMLKYVEKYGITTLNLVPPVVVALAKHPIVKEFDLSSVEGIHSGAAPLGREVILELESRFPKGKINLKQGYGMTEITCSAIGWDPNQTAEDASVGEPNPNVEIAVMTLPTEMSEPLIRYSPSLELPLNTRGELWIRAPNIMKGYWRKPDATASTLTEDNWLKTGDICYVDENHHVFIVDRLKELIKVKGNQVAPAELEAVLLEHPSVADVCVFGTSSSSSSASEPTTGEEKVRAYIVPQTSLPQPPSEQQIIEWIQQRCARYKWITGGVKFVESIPKNPSGKILRRLVKELDREEGKKHGREEGARL